MKNKIICSNCSAENPPYVYTCNSCNAYIRERVFNIDLWKIVGLLIESPKKAFKIIVFSEHKNFINFLLVFIVVKVLVDLRFISMISIGEFNTTTSLYLSYLIVLAGFSLYMVLFSVCITFINKLLNIATRFRDNIAVLTYSLLPNVFGIFFLFIIELVVFGEYLFSINPNPFVIKGIIAYTFAGAELLLILWSMFLTFTAFRTQTESPILSVNFTLAFYILFAFIIYYSSKIIFVL